MSKPIPGSNYIIEIGDSLSIIAAKAYGDPAKWPRIYNANQSIARSDDPNEVFPGEIYFIPDGVRTTATAGDLPGKGSDEMTLVIGGREVVFTSARVIRTMDTAADGWSARIEWTPGDDKELDKITLPYQYKSASVYIGGKLQVNGINYGISTAFSTSGRSKILRGASFTADIIDSTMGPPYERNNVTLEDLASDLVAPAGINAVFEADSGYSREN